MSKLIKKMVLGQPSWRLASDKVELFVTETGGHLGPVTFDRAGRKIQPLSVAPWAEEKIDPGMPPLLRTLRGDFFCMPFGGNARPFRGEKHPVHGETANAAWSYCGQTSGAGGETLTLSLNTTIRKACVIKFISLRQGHNAVYCTHVISGARGPMNLGHHAMVKFPDYSGSGVVSTSPIAFGQVYPGVMEQPADGGYTQLEPGARFTSLTRVPTVFGNTVDLSRYPARRGWEDIALLAARISACPASADGQPFAWTAATFPRERYVWFALKDPRVLRATVLWFSNGGRHYAPWKGRHINVLGLEEVTGYFHEGLYASARKNPLSARGLPTCLQLQPQRPLLVKYIQAVALIPRGFDRVAAIKMQAEGGGGGRGRGGGGGVVLKSASGQAVSVPLDAAFLHSAAPNWRVSER